MNKKGKYLLIVIAVLAVAGAAVFGGTYMKVKGEVEAVGENVFCNNIFWQVLQIKFAVKKF